MRDASAIYAAMVDTNFTDPDYKDSSWRGEVQIISNAEFNTIGAVANWLDGEVSNWLDVIWALGTVGGHEEVLVRIANDLQQTICLAARALRDGEICDAMLRPGIETDKLGQAANSLVTSDESAPSDRESLDDSLLMRSTAMLIKSARRIQESGGV